MKKQNLHSRIIFTAKLALPILAVLLLSMLFLLADRPDPAAAIPYATVNIEERAREQRLTAPRFSGQSADGAAFSLVADAAKPERGNPRKMDAEGLSLAVDGLQGNHTLHIKAAFGAVDTERGDVQLLGNVTLRSSIGFVLNTDALLAGFREFDLVSPGDIKGLSPFGTLTAGAMRLGTDLESGRQQMLFENGVRLLYTPEGG